MTPRLAPCLLLTLVACASTPRAENSAARRTRFVLVDGAGALRTRPDANAPGVSLQHEGALAFRRARVHGEWVELETVPVPERQCAAALAPPEGVRLRFFARASSLVPAVARSLRVAGTEGTYTLGVGLPVREAQGGHFVEIAHAGLRVRLPSAPAVTRAFDAPFAEPLHERAERLAPGTRALLPDGVVVEVDRGEPVYVLVRSPAAQGTRVVVSTPCVWFEARVPENAVLPSMEVEVPARANARLPRWVLRAGARLSWPDGSPAGRAVDAVAVTDDGRLAGDRRCVRVPLRVSGHAGAGGSADVEVCARARDVQEAGGAR